MNTVWVITVSPATANVLLCSHIISATIRLLIAASKGIDVTPDKLARSYPEVSLLLGFHPTMLLTSCISQVCFSCAWQSSDVCMRQSEDEGKCGIVVEEEQGMNYTLCMISWTSGILSKSEGQFCFMSLQAESV